MKTVKAQTLDGKAVCRSDYRESMCIFTSALNPNFRGQVCLMGFCNSVFSGESMGYIHCCGALHKTKSFRLVPLGNFLICELDYLKKCPVCGHMVVQLTRINDNKELSVIRKVNDKAVRFLEKIRKYIIYEIKNFNYNSLYHGKFYLSYNEFGFKKRCYSNLSTLKIGLVENRFFKKKNNINFK